MSVFRVNVVARNPRDESRATPQIAALVDTGSELTWLPAALLEDIGVAVDPIAHRVVARTPVVAQPAADGVIRGSADYPPRHGAQTRPAAAPRPAHTGRGEDPRPGA